MRSQRRHTVFASSRRNFDPAYDTHFAAVFESWRGVSLNGSAVSGWTDQKAAIVASQSTAANQPAFNSSGGPGNVAYMTFDGTNDFLDLGNVLNLNNAEQEVYIIYKTSQATTFRILQKRGTGTAGAAAGWQIAFNLGNGIQNIFFDDGAGNVTQPTTANINTINNGLWHVLNVRWANDNTINLYLDGSLISSSVTNTGQGAAGKNLTTSRNCTIGCAWDDVVTQSQFLNGSIVCVYVIRTILDDGTRQKFYKYLNKNLGFNL